MNQKNIDLLINFVPEYIFIFDLKTKKILKVNEKVIKDYEYSEEELYSMTYPTLHSENEREKVIKNIERLQDEIYFYYHRKKDGNLIPVGISFSEINFAGKKAVLSTVKNISE